MLSDDCVERLQNELIFKLTLNTTDLAIDINVARLGLDSILRQRLQSYNCILNKIWVEKLLFINTYDSSSILIGRDG